MDEIVFNKIQHFINSGHYVDALHSLRQELIRDPDDWNIYYLMGFCYRAINDFEMSIRCYSDAIEINPDDSSIYLGLGIVYQLNNDFENAIHTFEKAIQLKQNFIEAYNSLGLTYSKQRKYELAIHVYKQGIEKLMDSYIEKINKINPEIIGSSKDGKSLVVNTRLFDEVQKLLKSEIIYATLMNNIGHCNFELNQNDEAKKCFQESIEFTPDGINYMPPKIGMQKILSINN